MQEDCLSPEESLDDTDEFDKAAVRSLVWKQDLRIVPLSAFIYLLCYLDRSNIGIFNAVFSMENYFFSNSRNLGNAKILNADTDNDLLSETHMTDYQYT
jgi:hypothetical protein